MGWIPYLVLGTLDKYRINCSKVLSNIDYGKKNDTGTAHNVYRIQKQYRDQVLPYFKQDDNREDYFTPMFFGKYDYFEEEKVNAFIVTVVLTTLDEYEILNNISETLEYSDGDQSMYPFLDFRCQESFVCGRANENDVVSGEPTKIYDKDYLTAKNYFDFTVYVSQQFDRFAVKVRDFAVKNKIGTCDDGSTYYEPREHWIKDSSLFVPHPLFLEGYQKGVAFSFSVSFYDEPDAQDDECRLHVGSSTFTIASGDTYGDLGNYSYEGETGNAGCWLTAKAVKGLESQYDNYKNLTHGLTTGFSHIGINTNAFNVTGIYVSHGDTQISRYGDNWSKESYLDTINETPPMLAREALSDSMWWEYADPRREYADSEDIFVDRYTTPMDLGQRLLDQGHSILCPCNNCEKYECCEECFKCPDGEEPICPSDCEECFKCPNGDDPICPDDCEECFHCEDGSDPICPDDCEKCKECSDGSEPLCPDEIHPCPSGGRVLGVIDVYDEENKSVKKAFRFRTPTVAKVCSRFYEPNQGKQFKSKLVLYKNSDNLYKIEYIKIRQALISYLKLKAFEIMQAGRDVQPNTYLARRYEEELQALMSDSVNKTIDTDKTKRINKWI